jgi:hypothetical protein
VTLRYDLCVNQGETRSFLFPVLDGTGEPLPVDGWSARSQVRQPSLSAGVTPDFEWSTAVGNAVVAGTSVTLKLAPADTMAWNFCRARYDLILTDPSGDVTRLAEGDVILSAAVTR